MNNFWLILISIVQTWTLFIMITIKYDVFQYTALLGILILLGGMFHLIKNTKENE